MMIKLVALLAAKAKELKDREEGLALTEYVVVLGLVTSALVVAVVGFGGALQEVWAGWSTWIDGNLEAPDDIE